MSTTQFIPQLLAAIDRHDEADNWATWGAVMAAAAAVRGDNEAQNALLVDEAWRLDSEGKLPDRYQGAG